MSGMAARIALGAMMCGAAWVAGSGCSAKDEQNALALGEPVPAIELPQLDGSAAYQLGASGRAVLVNVWASWCAPCRQEMPSLQSLSRAVDSRELMVIGVNVDEDRYLALEFARTHALAFTQLADPGMHAMQKRWKVRTIPETLIIGADGRLLARVPGTRDWASAESRRLIAAALARGS